MPADELSILDLLGTAELDIEGRMPWSSNATFLARLVVDGEARGQVIYKPVRGERPLWDFEPGLHRREAAAYRLSAAMGLGIIPPTVLRDGPLGEGSAQWFVDADHSQHYFTIFESRDDVHDQLRAIAAFDIVANNTDRKSGHVLIDGEGRVWGIDNGLCFAEEFKLRTVVWEFGGEPLPESLRAAVEAVALAVPDEVAELLADDEVAALAERARLLADGGTFPVDPSGRRYPWPLV
ncbi:MAG: SCO1664 family protein [Ilumatobacteraceae bacterium]